MTVVTEGYPVQFEVDPPAAQNRLSIFFRWLLVIPHVIVLNFLGLAAGVVITFAWFTIVFAGRFPAGMLRFTIGFSRWAARANAYGTLLTDRYPPFSMEEEPDYPVRVADPGAKRVEGPEEQGHHRQGDEGELPVDGEHEDSQPH